MNTAVAFIVFRRPHTTAQVFARIRAARPPRLYIIADAARPDKPGETEKVADTRALLTEAAIDWPCSVTRLYAEENMGCRNRIVSGLDAVFANEPQAIILEDDCLPHPDFFRFCESALDRYRSSTSIGQIGGLNVLWGRVRFTQDAWFSRYALPWGWATWADRWGKCNSGIDSWTKLRSQQNFIQQFRDHQEWGFWEHIFEKLTGPNPPWDSWSYPWMLSHFKHSWLSLVPATNLIQNLGIGQESTHTQYENPSLKPPLAGLPTTLRLPSSLQVHHNADLLTFRIYFFYEEARRIYLIRNRFRIFFGKWKRKMLCRRQ